MACPFLSDQEHALRDEARLFADEVVLPAAAERDAESRFPREIFDACAQRGYTGLIVDPKYGGRGLGNVVQCLVFEELARVDASAHVTVSVHASLATSPLLKWGTEEQKQRWLPPLAKGELLGAYALTEPGAGSDAAALRTTAVRDGEDWVLNGSKMWITTGGEADFVIAFARTDPEARNAKGISAFGFTTDRPGFSAGKKEKKLGIRSSNTVQLFFEEMRIPGDSLLGELNQGFKMALSILNGGRVGIATQAVGIAQAAVDACTKELRARDAVGQSESFLLAEMVTRIEAARLLTWQAARLRDRDEDHIREASMAKVFASTTATAVCQSAVKMLGAKGWRSEGLVERFFRDSRVTELYEGTTEIQKLVIARTLLA